MQKEIYIHVTKEETKAAVLEDRKLVEVYLDRSFQRRLAGNIYKGRVANVLPGMQAAFVNIGLERNAFLYVEDARPNSGRSLPIQNTAKIKPKYSVPQSSSDAGRQWIISWVLLHPRSSTPFSINTAAI
jgi:Rne/Rng family ribonuclease